MRTNRNVLLVALTTALIAASSAGAATPPKSYWTVTRAESTVLAKVRIPFCRVWPASRDCANGKLIAGHPRLSITLTVADCVGVDERGSSFRYSRFTCAFTTLNDYAEGHLALYVTGPATFRWKTL